MMLRFRSAGDGICWSIIKKMRQTINKQTYTWVDIADPKDEDIQFLNDNFNIHPLTAAAIMPAFHYPDLDVFKDYLFIILHYPHASDNGEIQILEFDLIAGKNHLVTLHREDIKPIGQVFQNWQTADKKNIDPAPDASAALFGILNTFLKEVLAKVNGLAQEIDQMEARIFTGQQQELIRDISTLKMKIIDFWRIVEPQRMIFDSLRTAGANFFGAEHRHYFAILYQTHRRIENTLKNAKETIEALEETNHILVTVRMNEIIKVLTLMSVIFMPLTLLASVWGMNTNFLPFKHTEADFFYILLIMAATLAAMMVFFRHKKWL